MDKRIQKINKLLHELPQTFICIKTIKDSNGKLIFKKGKVYLGDNACTLIGIGGIYYNIICETGESLKISNLGERLLHSLLTKEDLENEKNWYLKLQKEGVPQSNLKNEDFLNAAKYTVTVDDKLYDSYGIYTINPDGYSCVYVPEKKIILNEWYMTNPAKTNQHKINKNIPYILEFKRK